MKIKTNGFDYGILSNVLFMLKTAFKNNKAVPIFVLLEACIYAGDNLISIFFAPSILTLIQNNVSVKNLLITVFLFAVSLMFLRGLLAYLKTNHLFGRIAVRSDLIFMIGNKSMSTSYHNLDSKDFNAKKKQGK